MPYKDIEKVREANRKSYYKNKHKRYKPCPECGEKIWITSKTCRRCRRLTDEDKEKLSLVSQGNQNPRWRGGRNRTKAGYVLIYLPDHPNARKNCVFEHRLVVEKHLGRYLTQKEVVHHIDGNKENNKIENLMVFQSTGKHMSFHVKVRQFGFTNPIKRQIKNRWKDLKNTNTKY